MAFTCGSIFSLASRATAQQIQREWSMRQVSVNEQLTSFFHLKFFIAKAMQRFAWQL
jgi:hypothetical protein